jgi:hypothetical protein
VALARAARRPCPSAGEAPEALRHRGVLRQHGDAHRGRPLFSRSLVVMARSEAEALAGHPRVIERARRAGGGGGGRSAPAIGAWEPSSPSPARAPGTRTRNGGAASWGSARRAARGAGLTLPPPGFLRPMRPQPAFVAGGTVRRCWLIAPRCRGCGRELQRSGWWRCFRRSGGAEHRRAVGPTAWRRNSRLTPLERAARRRGAIVAVVGDGINDASAPAGPTPA